MSDRERRRIAIATILPPEGDTGVQTHFRSFMRFASSQGLDMVLVTPHALGKLVYGPIFALRYLFRGPLSPMGVLWYRLWHYLLLKAALGHSFRHETPAVIYAQCPLSAKAALESAACRRGAEVVLVCHFNLSHAYEYALAGEIPPDGLLYRLIERTDQVVLPRLAGIVYVSAHARRAVHERVPAARAVPDLIVPNWTAPPPVVSASLRGDILSIGSLEPRKNQQFLLRVLAEARRMEHSYRLTLVGDGPSRESLQALCRELELTDLVSFVGHQTHAQRLMATHRVYAHSAVTESFGIVLIEALAAGRPVLAAPTGGIPEIFEDHVQGRYWRLDDVRGAAEILVEVLEHPERYAQMSRRALTRFYERFTVTLNAKRLVHFLRYVTEAPQPS